jgi:hypothetical protein
MKNLEEPQNQTKHKDDTQPSRPANFPPPTNNYHRNELSAPPRILLWGVVILFLLGIIGTLTGIYVFKNVLKPSQQVRVMGTFPFMEAFLPSRANPDDMLPTTAPIDDSAANDLLNLTLPGLGAEATEEGAVDAESSLPTTMPNAPTETAIPPTATIELPTATPQPTAVPTIVNTPEEIGDVSQTESPNAWPIAAYSTGYRYEQQTWNNCGPANITMALSYYGWQQDQAYAASLLKPEREDKNVSPHELVRFVNENSDIQALTRIGGDLELLRLLVANEFPVIVENGGTIFEGYDWMGHYRTIVGYNDTQQQFYIYDSFLGIGDSGEGVLETYDRLDEHWRVFNRVFIVVYHPQRENFLMELLGDYADPTNAAKRAADTAREEANANRQDAYAWFNLGSALTALGDYDQAAGAFDLAYATETGLPWRILWYRFTPYEALYETGRYEDVLSYAQGSLAHGAEYVEETYYWQGRAHAALGNTAQAADAYRIALQHNRLFAPAQEALNSLTQ